MFATIFVSGFVHEYLLSLALKFAAPILLLEFAGLGGIHCAHSDARLTNFMLTFSYILHCDTIWKDTNFQYLCSVWLDRGRRKHDILLSSGIGCSHILSRRGTYVCTESSMQIGCSINSFVCSSLWQHFSDPDYFSAIFCTITSTDYYVFGYHWCCFLLQIYLSTKCLCGGLACGGMTLKGKE